MQTHTYVNNKTKWLNHDYIEISEYDAIQEEDHTQDRKYVFIGDILSNKKKGQRSLCLHETYALFYSKKEPQGVRTRRAVVNDTHLTGDIMRDMEMGMIGFIYIGRFVYNLPSDHGIRIQFNHAPKTNAYVVVHEGEWLNGSMVSKSKVVEYNTLNGFKRSRYMKILKEYVNDFNSNKVA